MVCRLFTRIAVVSAFVIAAHGSAFAQVSGEGSSDINQPFGAIDNAVLDFLKANGLAGATVAVTRHGRLVWNKGYGFADKAAGVEMQPWHRSRIGSVSKLFTALAAMKLVENGQLSLTQPIYGDSGPYVSNNDPWPGDGVSWGVLQNAGDYWESMKTGVQNLYHQNFFNLRMNETIDWAKQITVGHLLSHTSGLKGSGDVAGAAAYFKKPEDQLTYKETHQFVLMGLRKDGKGNGIPPFASAPGTVWDYSNHGPGVAGMIVDELAGPGTTFRQYVEQNVLQPLGLNDVVPNNTSISKLDAKPHGADSNGVPYELDPNKPSTLGLASGGWSATARDLVRVMCSLDQGSNNQRILNHATVKLMQADPAPAVPGRPIGWDWNSGGIFRKDGLIGGGTAVVYKYLPGVLGKDEINVAIAVNEAGPALDALATQIASAAAKAYIPDEYDLFEPANRCYISGPQRFQVTAVTLTGFYPAGSSNPLPPKIVAKCPVNIGLQGTFQHIGKGKVQYRFRFLVENKVSTIFSTTITGDPDDPLYEVPRVQHTIQLPLPPAIKPDPKGGGIPPGPGQFTVFDEPEDLPFPKPKGPAVPGKVVAPSGSGIKGTVRLEVVTPTGSATSNPVHYDIECEPDMAILSGVVQLRDEDPKAPGCPRPASVGASIRTNKAGPVPYVLACTGGRTWNGKTTAHETAPNTFIGIAVHPIQIAKQEEITCVLRKGEQFGFSDVVATDKQLYPCKVTGVTTPTPLPPPQPPSGLKQPDTPPSLRFVCKGGRIAGTKTRPICVCPAGQVAKQTAATRFECETQLVCEGGRIANTGRPPRPACLCPSGMTAQKVVPDMPALKLAQKVLANAKNDEPDRYRCVRTASLPGRSSDTKPAVNVPAQIACSGGVVRAGKCYCANGKTLKNGVCVASSAPSRVR
jgi:CubicO group peptidase (beta-lactamase class C family)